MKRRWWIVLGSAGFAAIGLIVGLSVFFGDPINRENFYKVKPGMTEAEVQNILGPPSETDDMSIDLAMPSATPNGEPGEPFVCLVESVQTWQGRSATISVCVTEGGIVAVATFQRKEEMFLQKIRPWLGLDPPPDREAQYLSPASAAAILPD